MSDRSADVDDAVSGEAAPTGGRPRRPWWQLALPALLALLLVAGVVVGAVAFTKWRTDQAADEAQQDALSVAQQFTLRLDAVDYKNLDTYQKQVSALLTTKMRTDFKQNYSSFEPAFKAIQITSKGEVRAAGVQDIDEDSATVLVIHDVNVTAKGCVQPPYKRMKVNLVKVQGEWRVNDFTEDVPGCQG